MFFKVNNSIFAPPITKTTQIIYKMLLINIKENESIDKALKRFKKKFEKTGVLKQLRSRSAFHKPSVVRRKQVLKAVYKQKLSEGKFD